MGQGFANALGVQWGQSTPAMQVLGQMLNRGTRRATSTRTRTRKRKSTKKKAAAAGSRRRTRRTTRKARLVKGSAAAKRYMAKIRRMRKR